MATPHIVIFNDTHGWHSEQLLAALASYDVKVVLSDLAHCYVDLSHPNGFVIPELGDQWPDAVMVRGIAPGTFEQITLRMDFLHTLSEYHIPVFNNAKTIEHTVDKARTSLRLHQAGLATPMTWACESRQQARTIAQTQFAEGKELVIKPLFGCQGKGILKVDNLRDFDLAPITGDVFYLQQYIPPYQSQQWQDWRLMVIDDEVCAAMSRHATHWITNFAQGAQCLPAPLSDELCDLALRATRAVNADYAGVDLIRDQEGQFSVLEVNSVPAWKGLYQATGIDVAHALAQAIMTRIQANTHSQHA